MPGMNLQHSQRKLEARRSKISGTPMFGKSPDGIILRPEVSVDEYNYNYYGPDNIAYKEGYDLKTRRRKYADIIENIKNHCPPPIIDIGCGPGYLVHILRENGIEAFGCDFSPAALKLATPQSAPFLRKTNLTYLPYSDNEFGSSVCFHTLEHLSPEQIEKALNEITRITQKRFYGIIPTCDGVIQEDKKIKRQILEDPTHVSIMVRRWWLDKFRTKGWKEKTDLVRQFDRKNYGWVFVFDKT